MTEDMTAQPTLFYPEATQKRPPRLSAEVRRERRDFSPEELLGAPYPEARCWRCRKTTTHRLLTAYANGTRMVSCTECRAGSVLPR